MRLKVKCPDCRTTHLMRPEHVMRMLACPTCSSDFVPARDAYLSCPRCGSIVAANGDFRKERLSCVECDYALPEKLFLKMGRLVRRALKIEHSWQKNPFFASGREEKS